MNYTRVLILTFFSSFASILLYKCLLEKNDVVNFSISSSNILQKIPPNDVTKIIHFSWKTNEVPKIFIKYLKSWKELCFQNWTFMFWTDIDNYNLVKNHYPWFLEKYNALPGNIYRADVSRYFYLFHYGGIYTDLDNECLRPFEHLLKNYSLVFGSMKGQWKGTKLKEGYVQNSFMYSKPRQIFWLEMLLAILKFNREDIPEIYTGPVLLSNTIDLYRHRQINNHDIMIYPSHFFNPFSWIDTSNVDQNCKTNNQMSNENLEKCRKSMMKKGSYVVQYHAHTWG